MLGTHRNKVITIMVIRPLDDRIYCARSAFTRFGLGEKVHSIASQQANIFSNVLHWHFGRYPTGRLKVERVTFRFPGLGLEGDVGARV